MQGSTGLERAQHPTGAPSQLSLSLFPPMMASSPLPLPSGPRYGGGFKLEKGLLLRSVVVFQLKKHCAICLCVLPLSGWHWGLSGEESYRGRGGWLPGSASSCPL